jgi:pimeloyl-ACP methyl ester carboxylesterase
VARIVLVHGAGHGAWAWERLAPLLQAQGHTVQAPDLPGLGSDPTPPSAVTFQGYVDRVLEEVAQTPEPCILVGHSMGGAPVSQAAEAASAIRKLIYVSAVIPNNGQSMQDVLNIMPLYDEPSARDCMRVSATGDALEFVPEVTKECFYNTCLPDIADHALERLRPQAAAPLSTPLRLSASRWGATLKTYVICTKDRVLPPRTQEWFCSRLVGVKRATIDTDHSPFLSNPEYLADIIDHETQA